MKTNLHEIIRRNQTLKNKWHSLWLKKMKEYLEELRVEYKGEVDQNKRSAIKLKAETLKAELK